MKLLFDTNVVLDVILEREHFVEPATFLLAQTEIGIIEGYLCATTVTTLEYLITKVLGREKAKLTLKKLLQLFEISPVNRLVLESALQTKMIDFEDSVLHESAIHSELQGIVTRDKTGFKLAKIAIYTPQEMVNILTTFKKSH